MDHRGTHIPVFHSLIHLRGCGASLYREENIFLGVLKTSLEQFSLDSRKLLGFTLVSHQYVARLA